MKTEITKRDWIIIVSVIVFFFVGLFLQEKDAKKDQAKGVVKNTRSYEQVKESSLEYYGEVLAKRVVLNNLKAPKSADFGPIHVDLSGGHSNIVVTGYVDAQNSYGADIRTRFKITLWFNGDYQDEAYDDKKWILQSQEYDPN